MAKKTEKTTWQKINDWWNGATTSEQIAINANNSKANHGPITPYDVEMKTYGGRKKVIKNGLTETAKAQYDGFNGPLLDPTKGPMPQRYHRNKIDNILGEKKASQSDSGLIRWATESVAKDEAIADRKKWEEIKSKENESIEKEKDREKKLMSFLKGNKR